MTLTRLRQIPGFGSIALAYEMKMRVPLQLLLLFCGLAMPLASAAALADQSQTDKRNHWAFLAPQFRQPPRVKNKNWPRNPVDYFVLARLEKEGLAPSPEADRVTLLRRLNLDLIGLPATPNEIDEFVNDPS